MKFYVKSGILCVTLVVTYSLLCLPVILFYTVVHHDSYYEGMHVTSNNDTNLMDNATLALDAMNLNCSPGFFIKLETGRCSPMCSVWEDLPHDVVVTFNVAYFFVHTFQFVGALVAFALSIYSYRIMFKFPSILLVYFLLGAIVLDVAFLVNLAGQGSLLCHSSGNLIEIIEHPSQFCSFLGALNVFIVTMSTYWFLFHTISIFWKVWFPFHARKIEINGHTKYLHIAAVVITLIFSIVPVGVAFGTGGYVINSLILSGFRNCASRNLDGYFYSFILPICIIVAIATTLIVLILWKILKARLNLGMQANNFTAESKLMCFFVYFSITAVISFSALTVGLRNVSQNQQLFVRYFECQSFGVDPNNPCILEVDRRRDQALTFMFAVLLMFAPYTVMVYVVPVDKLKEKWQSWIKKSAP